MRKLLLKQLDARRVRLRINVDVPPMVINGYILRSWELGDSEDTLVLDIEPTGHIGPEKAG